MKTVENQSITKNQLVEELESLRKQIADLKQREYTYKQADELLHMLRINSPIGIFVIQDKKFVFTNREFLKILGYQSEEILGTHSLDHVHPRDRKLVREKAIGMLKGEVDIPYQYRIIGKDGQFRWILEGVVSVQFQGRRAVLGHSLNITDRIETEAKLRKLFENEKKLRRQLEAEVNKRIEYTRALVHELKTPLTPVLFSSELLAEELHEEPWGSIAHNIHRGATNLDNRINELLDIARGEIGLLKIKPRMIDARQLLKNVAGSIQPLMDRKKQIFIDDIPESIPQVWADEERFQQIILNLLINASKFSPEGSRIALRSRQDKGSLVVQVSDTGLSISRGDQKRIFKPYQKYNTGNHENLSGLGLGLSLCKSLVDLHGGKIWLESKKDEGNTFSFSIPLKHRVTGNPD
ncbi:ATP-binding protein [Chloroflexota bacterium]